MFLHFGYDEDARLCGEKVIGYVTRFNVDDDYVNKFEPHIVGADYHEELWVPAEELEEFNRHIVGTIEVIAEVSKG